LCMRKADMGRGKRMSGEGGELPQVKLSTVDLRGLCGDG